MERVEYDPEIDPSIREAQEQAERERELTARIRLEIERYAEENRTAEPGLSGPSENSPTPVMIADSPETESTEDWDVDEKARRRREREEKRRLKAEKRARRTEEGRKAFQSVFTGSILSSEWLRNMFPYLLGFALLLIFYIGNIFQLQGLHRTQQRLEDEIRELSIKAVGYSAERAQNTQRSAIVRQLEEKKIPLKEFPHPVRTIDRK